MGQKILVVEDNELNLKLFCDLLRAHGYETEPVRDGRDAVARARTFAPDLVVMDIQMPYVSGLELIEQMKSDEGLRRTPIMAVTAYAAKGDEERIRDAGAEGYVSKPISVVRFVEAVAGLLAAAAAAPPPAAEASGSDEARARDEQGKADAVEMGHADPADEEAPAPEKPAGDEDAGGDSASPGHVSPDDPPEETDPAGETGSAPPPEETPPDPEDLAADEPGKPSARSAAGRRKRGDPDSGPNLV